MKKWLSALLALAMVFTLLPVWSMGADTEEGGEESSWQFVPGHVSLETDFTYPTAEQARSAVPGMKRGTLPARYDSRKMQTSVKNQLYNGLCWAFATTAAFESSLKVDGVGTYDFSELHVGYSLSTYEYNGKVVNQTQGFNRDPGDGGNREIASAYFTRGTKLSGPVAESEDPYVDEVTDFRNPAVTESKTKLFTIGDIMYLTPYAKPTDEQVVLIKNAIMTYGGLDSSMRWPDGYWDVSESSCWNKSKSAFYYHGSYGANHEVLLVGWDDNFSRNNFPTKPSRDGAWLVKNSWGADWSSEGGYFWISYEDNCYPMEVSVFTGARPWTYDMKVYESDYKGTDMRTGSGKSADYAKVFTIQRQAGVKKSEVSSVRFFVPDGGEVKASVDVIPNFAGFDGYTFQARGVKEIAFPGWYTVELDTPVQLSGESFAVVLRLEGTGSLIYDETNGLNDVKAYSRSGDGAEFTAIGRNICLKAITRASTFTATPAISGSVKTAGQLTATVTAPQGAKLVAISYDEAGKPLDIRITAITSSCECREIVLQLKAGSGYKLMLMDGTTFMPLCAAWSV